jgi:hypothetical protein
MLTDYTKISDILSLHLNKVLKRETTPRQALQEVDAAIHPTSLSLNKPLNSIHPV